MDNTQQINPQQLQQAITWAKSNATDPRAVELQNRIQSGSLNSSLKTLGYDTSKFVTQQASTSTPPDKTLGDYSAETIKGATDTIGSRISDASKGYQEGVKQGGVGGLLKSTGSILGGGLGAASGFLQLLMSPVTATVNATGEKLGSNTNTLLYHIANSPIGDAIANGEKGISDYAQAHPHVMDALNVGLASLLGGKEDITLPDTTTLKNDVSNITTPIKENLSVLKDKIINVKDKTIALPGKIKEAIIPTLTPEEEIGKIIQGKTTDIPAAQRTFKTLSSNINPSKMSSRELSDTIQNKIDENMKTVDTHFSNDNNPHSMKDFNQTTGTGKSTIKTNYVEQAINQLKDFYSKTNDAQGLSDIIKLENKALGEPLTPKEINNLKNKNLKNTNYKPPTKGKSKGLSSKELNDLAKEHGSTIKAFNANNEAASGLTKQAAENTRTGVKATARKILSENNKKGSIEVTRLDKETSDAIHTKNLLDKQTEKEAIGVQKKGKQNFIDKFAKKNPKTTKAIKYGATAVIGGEAIKHILP